MDGSIGYFFRTSIVLVLAIEWLHKHNIMHRDIKPGNILVDKDSNVRLADFGLSKLYDEHNKKFTLLGTIRYLAPELIAKSKDPILKYSIDWWGVGQMIYVMLFGQPVFHCPGNVEKTIQKIKRGLRTRDLHRYDIEISPAAQDILKRLLTLDPKIRLGSLHGANEIKTHPWFRGLNWHLLANKKLEVPPFTRIPTLQLSPKMRSFVTRFLKSVNAKNTSFGKSIFISIFQVRRKTELAEQKHAMNNRHKRSNSYSFSNISLLLKGESIPEAKDHDSMIIKNRLERPYEIHHSEKFLYSQHKNAQFVDFAETHALKFRGWEYSWN